MLPFTQARPFSEKMNRRFANGFIRNGIALSRITALKKSGIILTGASNLCNNEKKIRSLGELNGLRVSTQVVGRPYEPVRIIPAKGSGDHKRAVIPPRELRLFYFGLPIAELDFRMRKKQIQNREFRLRGRR